MDTETSKKDVSAQLNDIRSCMPETYKTIQAKAAEIGNTAFTLVRRGLRGEPNCFFAVESGKVMGTPFTQLQGADWIAEQIRQFGCTYVCTFPVLKSEAAHGAD